MAVRGAQLDPAEEPPRPGSRGAPLTVTQLVRGTNRVLERTVGTIYVQGEVTGLKRAASGHVYFALTDGSSRIDCVLWRSDARRLRFRIDGGLTLLCRGRLGIYERDGRYQMYVNLAEPAGVGADALALEQLKKKLAAEGLFDAERKRPLPLLPGRIGVVTSKSGAAVRDVIRAVQRRCPVPILVADCRVQGPEAPRSIVSALRAVCATDIDVVILGRGGGAVSDLAAFNDEAVVRAVAECPVPIVSAVGHEVDVSLSDLAADHRAATPTMAGEMAVPVAADLLAELAVQERRLGRELAHRLRSARQELDQALAGASQCLQTDLGRRHRALAELQQRIEAQHPRARLVAHRSRLRELAARADDLAERRVTGARQELIALAGRLEALSPLRVLHRGYALATARGHVVRRAADVEVGDDLRVRLAEGSVDCQVVARSDGRAKRT